MVESDNDFAAFISHSSTDFDKALALAEQLETRGLRCWLAPRDIRPSHSYGQEISRGIEHSRCLILLVSEEANRSAAIRNEVELAFRKSKPIFPVRIEDVPPGPEIEFFVSSVQWIDAWKGRLTDYIEHIADSIERGQVAPAAAQPRKRGGLRHAPTALGVAAALLIAALIYWELTGIREEVKVAGHIAGVRGPTPAPPGSTSKGRQTPVATTARRAARPFDLDTLALKTSFNGYRWQIDIQPRPRLRGQRLSWSQDGVKRGNWVISGRLTLPPDYDRKTDTLHLLLENRDGTIAGKIARKIDFPAAFRSFVKSETVKNDGSFIRCNVYGCAIKNHACAPEIKEVAIAGVRWPEAALQKVCVGQTRATVRSVCFTPPVTSSPTAPGKAVTTTITFDNGESVSAAPPKDPVTIGREKNITSGWGRSWTELTPAAQSGVRFAPTVLASFRQSELVFAPIIADPQAYSGRCRAARNLQVFYDIDGKGLLARPVRTSSGIFDLKHPLAEYGDRIALRFKEADGTDLGTHAYRFDLAKLIRKTAEGRTPRAIGCSGSRKRGHKCHGAYSAEDLLPLLRVARVEYGPEPDDLTRRHAVDVTARSIIAANGSPTSAISLKLPGTWENLYFRYVYRDGSASETMRRKLR